MTVFVDTSSIYALIDRSDPRRCCDAAAAAAKRAAADALNEGSAAKVLRHDPGHSYQHATLRALNEGSTAKVLRRDLSALGEDCADPSMKAAPRRCCDIAGAVYYTAPMVPQ